ncbi:F-box/LRR-repeat protein 2 isoform X1 [Cricetulus griseus]|uniref:F-box/LRR-repeat protein 2 isoform X1 n=1 Tax=Cricetulus griseus TaxID=10029 RepID=UPI0007DA8800|nr:F-box/LRR-repeat protein 2 isoform X1 [Cricetulus griseus]
MAQRVKVLAANPDDLSATPRPHKREDAEKLRELQENGVAQYAWEIPRNQGVRTGDGSLGKSIHRLLFHGTQFVLLWTVRGWATCRLRRRQDDAAAMGEDQVLDAGRRDAVLSDAPCLHLTPGTSTRWTTPPPRRRSGRACPGSHRRFLSLLQVFSNNDDGLINKKLPKELLLRIFSFLDIVTLCRCAQISKAWNILALDGSNWQRIDLFNFQTDVEGQVVENISKRCGGFLRKLSLRGCIGVGDSSLKTFAQNCRNIEHLNLNGCTKITDSTCYSLGRFCSKLKHLDLTSCVSVTNSSLKGISDGCRNLEYLNLSWCDQITKDGIEALVRGCRGLKALLLRGCTQLEDEALRHIQCPTAPVHSPIVWPHLPKVDGRWPHHPAPTPLPVFLGAESLRLIFLAPRQCWARLLSSSPQRITDDGVVQICRGCHRLQALCLSGCSNLTDASLTALGLNCPRLQILEAARCSHLTDAGFTLLARNCHDLEKMDLEECVLITDSTLIQLSIHCPKLQALSLSHCELITDEGILHLSSSTCGHERLRVLELDNCLLVTDAALEHLENCRGLERLELYDCQQVTRAGIKRMRAQLPHVKVHAYFAPVTPPPAVAGSGHRLCRCCVIL